MKAPETIFINKLGYGCPDEIWTEQMFASQIEYVRKDAFIKKVMKFMEKINDVDEYFWYNEEEHTAGITEKCIEDFKKYMK